MNWQNNGHIQDDGGHFVQFYHYDHGLLRGLEKFIGGGIKKGDSCLVIATKNHLSELEKKFIGGGIKLAAAKKSGQYVGLDAAKTLARLMGDGQPDEERFWATVGSLVALSAGRGKPVRAFGEMVALLWKKGNLDGALRLEELWNELAKKYRFTLFCAYPQNHFDMEIHRPAIEKISRLHSRVSSPDPAGF